MKSQFNGERLKKARIYRGLKVAELAERVGCQRQTLSMYEICKSQPADSKIVELISRELDFPVDFFYEHPEPIPASTIYFRSLLTTSKKYRTEQVVKMEFLAQIYSLLQDYIEFPRYEPLCLVEETTTEEAAIALRNAWGLGYGPVENLITVVEQHGILVTSFSTSTDDVDAFSQFIDIGDNPTYLIAYSNNKTSASRIHFDIAHELGHICLHEWSDEIESYTKEEFKQREQQANDFAAAFLLPEISFKQDALRAPAGSKALMYYKQLKKKWRVSIAAMIRRARDLGVMTMDEYQTLIKIMQRRGQRKEEPLDDVLITASPSLLKTSIIMLLQEGVFSRREFMEELSSNYNLSIKPEEIEYLLDLPVGTLIPPKVVAFSSLQIKQQGK